MGTSFGDYDSDGDLDWFITNITNDPEHPGPFGGWNRLYRNDGNRHFTDTTQAAGVRDSRFSWGTTFFDYDNDGDVDLSATNGYNGAGWIDDQTFLWQNNDGVFTDVSTVTGITDTRQGRGLIHLDYDSDGDLDLLVINNADAPILYRNDGGNDNHFLRIKPQGTVSNRDGIGAWITVTPDLAAPDQKLVWEIDGGSSFVSQSERIAHFGFGASTDPVELVTIEWSSGIVQHLYDVSIDQTLLVIEAPDQMLGDYNEDGTVNAADYTFWRDHLGQTLALAGENPAATTTGVVDEEDFEFWRLHFGESLQGGGSSASQATVPESATWLLAIVASVVFGRFRQR